MMAKLNRDRSQRGAVRGSVMGALAVGALLLGGAAGWGLAGWHAAHRPGGGAATDPHAGHDAAPAADPGAAAAPGGERQVLYWYDPMKPDARFDKPGRSPFMDMDLVPRYADEAGSGGVQINPVMTQSLGMRLASVQRATLGGRVDAVGTLGFSEREVAVVQTRTAGFVQRVYARAPGDVVAAGAALADVLVPEWAGAQQEYLAVRATGEAALTAAARQRLLLLGMEEAQIQAVERSGQTQPVLTVRSPLAGVIQELMVREGMSLAPMMTLARINGLGTMWLEVAVPEVQAPLVLPGRPVQVRLQAWPGEVFQGRVAAILPEAARETRTLRVRVELPNRGGRLQAGLFAQASIQGPESEALVVPAEAVIRTGQRTLVFIAGAEPGQFTPVTVRTGREIDDRVVILEGLSEGQQVVTSGQFLVDSEASLSAVVTRTAPVVQEVRGRVEGLAEGEITLWHEPIPALRWPAMTMPFKLKSPQQAQGLKSGDSVRFRFTEDAPGEYTLEHIEQEAAK